MHEDPLARYVRNPGPKRPVVGLRAACSTDNAIVTETVLKVLSAGGNAADAAIAGSLVQSAVEPYMTNLTGTVTFLYYEAETTRLYQLDSVGTFPAGLRPFKPIPRMSSGYGTNPPSACIPGCMPGLKAIHERFGTKPWAWLCEDAIRWAEQGHPVTSLEYGSNTRGQDFEAFFPEGRRFYMPDGYLVPVGGIFRHPEMAATLRGVAAEGPDYMIIGGWAKHFVAKANQMGWAIEMRHMIATPPRWIEPLRFRHQEYEVVSLAPPEQQGVLCAIVLGILSHLGIRDVMPRSPEHIFFMGHALRYGLYHCGFIGDPVVSDYAIAQLIDDDFHRMAAHMIKGMRPKVDLSDHVRLTAGPGEATFVNPTAGEPTGAIDEAPSAGSCELSIVDARGNWVQMMTTLQSGGIPGMVVGGVPMVGSHAGFGGLTGWMDTRIVEGARPRCVIGNTMVLKDGKPVYALGTPGNCFCTVPQVLTYLLDFKLAPYDAIDAPRMLPLAEDGSVTVEDRLSPECLNGLARMGVRVRAVPQYNYQMGSFQMCFTDERSGGFGALADPRRCGVADGFP